MRFAVFDLLPLTLWINCCIKQNISFKQSYDIDKPGKPVSSQFSFSIYAEASLVA